MDDIYKNFEWNCVFKNQNMQERRYCANKPTGNFVGDVSFTPWFSVCLAQTASEAKAKQAEHYYSRTEQVPLLFLKAKLMQIPVIFKLRLADGMVFGGALCFLSSSLLLSSVLVKRLCRVS